MFDIQTDAVTFDLYYGGKSVVEVMESGEKSNNIDMKPVDETTPEFRDIYIEDVVCRNANRALFFNGLPEKPIENIHLKNIRISANIPSEFHNCRNITRENVQD